VLRDECVTVGVKIGRYWRPQVILPWLTERLGQLPRAKP
jgi:hypothetical protein